MYQLRTIFCVICVEKTRNSMNQPISSLIRVFSIVILDQFVHYTFPFHNGIRSQHFSNHNQMSALCSVKMIKNHLCIEKCIIKEAPTYSRYIDYCKYSDSCLPLNDPSFSFTIGLTRVINKS